MTTAVLEANAVEALINALSVEATPDVKTTVHFDRWQEATYEQQVRRTFAGSKDHSYLRINHSASTRMASVLVHAVMLVGTSGVEVS